MIYIIQFFFFFIFNMVAQEGGERFELVNSALLGVVPADYTVLMLNLDKFRYQTS